MNELDRYDYALTMLFGGIATGALALGAPLWAIAPIYMTLCTIVLYRHLPLPPRRKR
jgi:hypothetical protein